MPLVYIALKINAQAMKDSQKLTHCCCDVVQPIVGPLFWAQGPQQQPPIPNSVRPSPSRILMDSSILYTDMILMLSKKKRKPTRTTLAAKLQHQHHQLCDFVIFVKCRVPWTAQCGADEKFTHILTTLGHCCLKESRRAAFWGSNPKMQRSSDSFALFICEVLFAQRIQMWSFEHPFRNLSCDQVNWSASSKRARCFDLWER